MIKTAVLLCYDISEAGAADAAFVACRNLTQTFVSGTTKEPKPHPLPFGRFRKL
jgi:hypothetical protein